MWLKWLKWLKWLEVRCLHCLCLLVSLPEVGWAKLSRLVHFRIIHQGEVCLRPPELPVCLHQAVPIIHVKKRAPHDQMTRALLPTQVRHLVRAIGNVARIGGRVSAGITETVWAGNDHNWHTRHADGHGVAGLCRLDPKTVPRPASDPNSVFSPHVEAA